jgi:hypothetical protein
VANFTPRESGYEVMSCSLTSDGSLSVGIVLILVQEGLFYEVRLQPFFFSGATAQCRPGLPHSFFITYSDTPQLVGLLWTRDQLVAETSTSQHTILTTVRHPCPRYWATVIMAAASTVLNLYCGLCLVDSFVFLKLIHFVSDRRRRENLHISFRMHSVYRPSYCCVHGSCNRFSLSVICCAHSFQMFQTFRQLPCSVYFMTVCQ